MLKSINRIFDDLYQCKVDKSFAKKYCDNIWMDIARFLFLNRLIGIVIACSCGIRHILLMIILLSIINVFTPMIITIVVKGRT